jgi:F-type H+-transporting ATPase subunit delta
VSETIAARRYAKSFLFVAASKNIVEEAEDQLLSFKQAYRTEPRIHQFMTNPRIPLKAKVGLIRRTFQGKVHPATAAFLEILVRRRRIDLIPQIADAFDEMADAFRGTVRVRVHTFLPLADAQAKSLEAQVTRLVRGAKIDMEVERDPSLLGGLWVKIGDTLLDGSVATKLKSLRERLLELRPV